MHSILRVVLFIVALSLPSLAFAENIKKINIVGNQRVELSTIYEYLGVKAGDKYSEEKAREAEEAATRCRALERVIIEGKIGSTAYANMVMCGGSTNGEQEQSVNLVVQSLVERASIVNEWCF